MAILDLSRIAGEFICGHIYRGRIATFAFELIIIYKHNIYQL